MIKSLKNRIWCQEDLKLGNLTKYRDSWTLDMNMKISMWIYKWAENWIGCYELLSWMLCTCTLGRHGNLISSRDADEQNKWTLSKKCWKFNSQRHNDWMLTVESFQKKLNFWKMKRLEAESPKDRFGMVRLRVQKTVLGCLWTKLQLWKLEI